MQRFIVAGVMLSGCSLYFEHDNHRLLPPSQCDRDDARPADAFRPDVGRPDAGLLPDAGSDASIDAAPPPLDASSGCVYPDAAPLPKPTSDEALLELDRIAAAAKRYFLIHSTFPSTAPAVLPGADGGACSNGIPVRFNVVPSATWQGNTGWDELGFEIGVPNRFSYHYLGYNLAAQAMAVGDLDCDGTKITYTLDLSAPNGVPLSTITEPPPGQY